MVQRRPRGHIRQRPNGKLQVLVYAGRDPVTGRQRCLAETVATRAEAERTLTRLLHQVDEQRNPNTRATVGHLLDRWLEVADLELSTRHGYQGLIERKVRPVLGSMPLRRLTVDLLDRFYAELRQHGHRCQRCARLVRQGTPPLRAGQRHRPAPDGPERVHEPDCARGLPLAPSTVRQVHFILRAALNQAVRWGWIASDPATLASPPKFGRYEAHPPSPEDVAKLLNAAWARDVDFGTLLWPAITTGIRRGELCALRWWHVDLHARELQIERSHVQRGKQHKEKATKTHQARRIALDDATVALLTAHRERGEQLAALVGASLPPSAYVFGPEPGGRTLVLPDAVTQRFRRLAKRLGVPASLHGFRHYSATQLLAAGVDLQTVAGRLGHGGGGATTLRVYASFVAAADAAPPRCSPSAITHRAGVHSKAVCPGVRRQCCCRVNRNALGVAEARTRVAWRRMPATCCLRRQGGRCERPRHCPVAVGTGGHPPASGLNATAFTGLSWVRAWSCRPLLVSQIRAVLSSLPVAKSKTSLAQLSGVGPVLAATFVGEVGDIRRFPSKHLFAAHTGTAPLEASSGQVVRHRLSRAGDRKLNHALHMMAMVQVRRPSAGQA